MHSWRKCRPEPKQGTRFSLPWCCRFSFGSFLFLFLCPGLQCLQTKRCRLVCFASQSITKCSSFVSFCLFLVQRLKSLVDAVLARQDHTTIVCSSHIHHSSIYRGQSRHRSLVQDQAMRAQRLYKLKRRLILRLLADVFRAALRVTPCFFDESIRRPVFFHRCLVVCCTGWYDRHRDAHSVLQPTPGNTASCRHFGLSISSFHSRNLSFVHSNWMAAK